MTSQNSDSGTDAPKAVEKRPSRSLAEWITFAASSLLLSAIAGLVVYDWATRKDTPPVLAVNQQEEIRETDGQYYIPFQVVNTGGTTAESVQVIAELRVNGTVREQGDLQIDFLSEGEAEQGAFIFQQNPRQGELVLRVGSYKEP